MHNTQPYSITQLGYTHLHNTQPYSIAQLGYTHLHNTQPYSITHPGSTHLHSTQPDHTARLHTLAHNTQPQIPNLRTVGLVYSAFTHLPVKYEHRSHSLQVLSSPSLYTNYFFSYYAGNFKFCSTLFCRLCFRPRWAQVIFYAPTQQQKRVASWNKYQHYCPPPPPPSALTLELERGGSCAGSISPPAILILEVGC